MSYGRRRARERAEAVACTFRWVRTRKEANTVRAVVQPERLRRSELM
jgi:hypothetical protein